MLTFRQALFTKDSAGDPLPTVWKSLESRKTRFMRGQLVLICAAPGIGKSGFISSYGINAGIPALYFSADSDQFTQTTRALSILTGDTQEKSAEALNSENPDALSRLDEQLVRWNFESQPTLDDIETSLKAYEEVYGDFPHLVVVDNITNVISGFAGNEDDPFGGLESLMDWLHKVARDTGACVVGLHHVKGDHNDGNKPIPLSGIKGQIGRVPEMVLTLHRITNDHGTDTLNVAAVKNRSGRANPSGRSFVGLEFDGETMSIRDFQ